MQQQSTPLSTFVAVDVEYATREKYICQLGIAVVSEQEIVEQRSWLIQPPGNRYESGTTATHHITAADTATERIFPDVWDEIEPYLRNRQLWAHNASTERDALAATLSYYDIPHTPYTFHDSIHLYRRPDRQQWNHGNGLPQCCMALGIPFDESQHHSAEYDAVKCAEIIIAYTEGRQPDWTGVPVSKEELRKQQQTKVVLRMGEFQDYAARIEAAKAKLKEVPAAKAAPASQLDLFAASSQPDLFTVTATAPGNPSDGIAATPLATEEDTLLHHTDLFAEISSTRPGAEPQLVDVFDSGDRLPKEGREEVDYSRLNTAADNPLQGCKVAITGTFRIHRDAIKQAIKAMGAAVTSSISKKTSAVLIGTTNAGLPKLADVEKLAYNGYIIPRIVGNDDLDRFLYDDPAAFGIRQGDTPRKQLDLTWAHLQESTWPLQYPANSISGKEIYLPSTVLGNRQTLAQVFGNLGAYANNELDADTQLILLPVPTVTALQRGEKDDLTREIEQFYNALSARTFDLSFLLLSDFLTFVHSRLAECPDPVTGNLLSAYEASCTKAE